KGSPFIDPSDIAVGKSATYVTDAVASDTKLAEVFIVQGGNASIFLAEAGLGYPARVALSLDKQTLFLSGINVQTNNNELLIVDVASKAITVFNDIDKNRNAANLHRAKTLDFFAWADFGANDGAGSVFSINCQ